MNDIINYHKLAEVTDINEQITKANEYSGKLIIEQIRTGKEE